jgi:hypothetical protein
MLAEDQFLCGYNLAKMCDYVFAQHDIVKNNNCRWDDLKVTHRSDIEGLQNNSIVYCKTDFVPYLTDLIKCTDKKVCIITHDSDYPITQKLIDYCLVSNIVAWYGVNINVKNDRVFSIPLGIGNTNVPETPKPVDLIQNFTPSNSKLLYINHRIETYPQEREEPYKLFTNSDWTTVDYPTPKGEWDHYLYKLKNHKFMLCPRGNGIDTYRFWESQYSDVIPIVKNSINIQFYKDILPMLVVDSYSDINEQLLLDKLKECSQKTFNKNILSCSYWIDKIKNHL